MNCLGLKIVRPLTDRVLHTLHNLAAVNSDSARTVSELAQFTQESVDKIHDVLKTEETAGHVKMFSINNELRYYLTGLGSLGQFQC
jgi:predicted transcriptional regulator